MIAGGGGGCERRRDGLFGLGAGRVDDDAGAPILGCNSIDILEFKA